MRISTIQQFNSGVRGIQDNYSNATRTQEQISTGNRILTPADDPVASVRLLQLEQQQNVLGQYNSNLTAAKNSLTQEEVKLNSVNTVLQRVRELPRLACVPHSCCESSAVGEPAPFEGGEANAPERCL